MITHETRLVKIKNAVVPVQPRWQVPEPQPWMDGQFKLVTIERDTETGSVRRLPEAKHDKITLPTLAREPLPEPQE